MSEAADKAIPCLNCGYDVTGMKPEGVCPECAQPVLASVHAGDLVYSSPEYVQGLLQGVWTLRWSVGLGCTAVLGILTGIWADFDVISDLTGALVIVSVALLVFGAVLWFAGLWMTSAPESHCVWRESRWTPRRWTRSSTGWAFAFLCAAIALFPLSLVGFPVFVVVLALFALSPVVQLFTSIAMLTRLAERAGEEKNHPLPVAMYIAAFLFVVLVWFAHAFVTMPLMIVYFVALVRLTRRLKDVQARQQRLAAEKAGPVS